MSSILHLGMSMHCVIIIWISNKHEFCHEYMGWCRKIIESVDGWSISKFWFCDIEKNSRLGHKQIIGPRPLGGTPSAPPPPGSASGDNYFGLKFKNGQTNCKIICKETSTIVPMNAN